MVHKISKNLTKYLFIFYKIIEEYGLNNIINSEYLLEEFNKEAKMALNKKQFATLILRRQRKYRKFKGYKHNVTEYVFINKECEQLLK